MGYVDGIEDDDSDSVLLSNLASSQQKNRKRKLDNQISARKQKESRSVKSLLEASSDDEGLETNFGTSPKRNAIRMKAFESQKKQQGKKMQKQTATKHNSLYVIPVGKAVQMGIPTVDRGKVDQHNLTLVVVHHSVSGDSTRYKVAARTGVLKETVGRTDLSEIKQGNLKLLHLEDALANWKSMKEVSARTLATSESNTGVGQGYAKCYCTGKCDTGKCSCFKAGRTCNSRCHNSNQCCANQDMHKTKT